MHRPLVGHDHEFHPCFDTRWVTPRSKPISIKAGEGDCSSKNSQVQTHLVSKQEKEALVKKLLAETSRNGELQKIGASRAVGLTM